MRIGRFFAYAFPIFALSEKRGLTTKHLRITDIQNTEKGLGGRYFQPAITADSNDVGAMEPSFDVSMCSFNCLQIE